MAMSRRQEQILVWLLEQEQPSPYGVYPPSTIAWGIGMNKLPPVVGGGSGSGRGSGHRVFNPAQRIISSLTGLRNRGLVYVTGREDGLSGSAYGLTDMGLAAARELAGVQPAGQLRGGT